MAAGSDVSDRLEDYLEAILHIENKKRAARAKDVANRLNVTSSSVTGALRALSEKGLINYEPYDLITLTPDGARIARDVALRHTALRDFFVKVLRVDESEAEEAACKMEHSVSSTILQRFTRFVEYIDEHPLADAEWFEGLQRPSDGRSAGSGGGEGD
jgi:DtxR family Mn-dependent transcriptional regulator